jgi:histidine triad (HIT) family protein
LNIPDCIFCKIVWGQSPAKIVDSWYDAIAILPLNPVIDGHVLIVPKVHVKDALEDRFVTGATMNRAAQFAKIWYSECNIITSVGKNATQSIFHLHVHIVPRTANDGLLLPWTKQ